MKITLTRKIYGEDFVVGRLTIEGTNFSCYTLEDKVRQDGVKVDSLTAIPAGTYSVIINHSTRFKCLMPLLLNVPNFSGIRIHRGNTVENTEGCLLLGSTLTLTGEKLFMGRSADAFEKFWNILFKYFTDIPNTSNVERTADITIIDTYKAV